VLENVFEIEMDMGDRKQWTKNLDEPVLDLGKHLKKTWGNPGYQFSGFKKKRGRTSWNLKCEIDVYIHLCICDVMGAHMCS
jgi:hypothetical protein